MKKNGFWIILFGLTLIVLSFRSSSGQNQISFEVGVTGDDSARGNMGIRASIQTHLYDTYPVVFDYFWVGSSLANGAFIQFGYGFQPGPARYCLKAFVQSGITTCLGKSELVSNTEGRWEWQYWPNMVGHDFYYEIGPANSVGLNGTWHDYSIVNSNSTWEFLFDNAIVGNLSAPASGSKDPPLMLAEKTGTDQLVGSLGPVVFRDLEYLTENGWRHIESLFAVRSCSPTQNCDLNQPYGVELVGDYIVTGSVNRTPVSGELVWTSGYVTLNVIVHPDTQFGIWTYEGQRQFVHNATMEIPRGMLAYVSLTDTSVPVPGVLGLLGVKDEFEGWIGSMRSGNSSLQILMENSIDLKATWKTDYQQFEFMLLGMVIVFGVVSILTRRFVVRRHGDSSRTCASS